MRQHRYRAIWLWRTDDARGYAEGYYVLRVGGRGRGGGGVRGAGGDGGGRGGEGDADCDEGVGRGTEDAVVAATGHDGGRIGGVEGRVWW